jgi:sigma-B regulation protein RsbU (phosphoserine phosphatase)
MVAAKIVGGDLYDYCALDNGNIFVSIADVSDKGVTAALFMARAVTMLHQYAKLSYSPSKILYEYNNSLAKHNPNLMFITTFAAIYNPKTKVLTYSNAGHNVPYIISDTLIKLDDEIGSAAGVFEDEAYPEFEIKLNDGDMLFLYTDGVTDAQNRDGGFFGEETLERILLESKSSGAKGVVNAVNDEIKAFVNGAEQFDDVTMLALQINSESGNRLHLEAKTENLVKIEDKISALDLSEEMRVQLNIIAEEIFVNICSYSYPETAGEVDVIIENENGKVTMTFEDSGIPFNQGENVIDIEDYDSENAVGGLGRFITFSMADDYSYERKDNKNILKIIKNIQENV